MSAASTTTQRLRSPRSRAGSTVATALAAIAERDPELNAFITVCERVRGAQGVPLAVKDIFDTAGIRTTYGSRIYRNNVPECTAEAVLRLQQAGYVVVGKTNMHEFAYGMTGENPHYGPVRNPHDATRMAGGSSGGSATAVAAGMAELGLGTDTGGSIRIPAAMCGVVGFKPSFGAVSVKGCFPLAPSFDHVGVLAPDVERCEHAFSMLTSERVSPDPVQLRALRVGVPEQFVSVCAPGVEAAFRAALIPFSRCTAVDFLAPDSFDNAPMLYPESLAVHRRTFPARAADYGDDVAARLERGFAFSAVEYLRCRDQLAQFCARCEAALEGIDLLALPTLPIVAPPLGTRTVRLAGQEYELRELLARNTRIFNCLGWPALAIPCGTAEHSMPASLTLIGAPGRDALVLAAGVALMAHLAAPDGGTR